MKTVKLQLAKTRKELRPHGVTAAGCEACGYFEQCQGIQPKHGVLFDCFTLHCKKGACDPDGKCDNVCPYNPKFHDLLRDVGGSLDCDGLPKLVQRRVKLPCYVPVIEHGYKRHFTLEYPVVALKPYQLFTTKNGRYESKFNDGTHLRSHYRIGANSQIILRGIDEDHRIEKYWKHHRRDSVAEQLVNLGITMMIGPNFSHFLDVVRTDNMYNKKRLLMAVLDLASAGICAVPHLSGRQPGDLIFWKNYLRKNSGVKYVAIEFETGNRSPKEAILAVSRLVALRDSIGRPLHPLIVGGKQIIGEVATHFPHFTLIDSTPFTKARCRHQISVGNLSCNWHSSRRLFGIDDLLDKNVNEYAQLIDAIRSDVNSRRKRVG